MTNLIRVNRKVLTDCVSARMQTAGLLKDRADKEANIMVDADLLEVPSHGVRMLPNLLAALEEKRVNANPIETLIKSFGAISVLDCDNGSGRVASLNAMEKAVQQSKEFGVGVCLAKNTSHWGRGHAYASYAAKQGHIGICTTNAIPSMAAWGATSRIIGNNPLAIGMPSAQPEEPIVLDMAMSQAAVGKVATMLRENTDITSPLGFNPQGEPSTDAQAILAGAVSAMGAHKGEGLALMMEMLTATLAGAAFSFQLLAKDKSGADPDSTKIFIALNVQEFVGLDTFYQQTSDLFTHLKQVTPAFMFPSERGWQAKRNNLVKGVPVHTEIAQTLRTVGVDLFESKIG
ncbi:Ldh family oxidoreductase [Paraglaciecola sp.]|uniref:Ldh family oxidoreductase n=1 Tax=Paraglaciecola sp. TaxID=1920173 RepID=UPI003EF6DDD1